MGQYYITAQISGFKSISMAIRKRSAMLHAVAARAG
jgi:hypothetical protein